MAQFKAMELHVNKQVIDWSTVKMTAGTSAAGPFYLPSLNGYLVNLFARVITAFEGVTHPTVKLGDSTDTELLITKQPIDQTGNLKVGKRGQDGYCTAMNNPGGSKTNYALQLTFESASGNLSSLTAGEIEFVTLYATEK